METSLDNERVNASAAKAKLSETRKLKDNMETKLKKTHELKANLETDSRQVQELKCHWEAKLRDAQERQANSVEEFKRFQTKLDKHKKAKENEEFRNEQARVRAARDRAAAESRMMVEIPHPSLADQEAGAKSVRVDSSTMSREARIELGLHYEGERVQIYSFSKKKWCQGIINKIFAEGGRCHVQYVDKETDECYQKKMLLSDCCNCDERQRAPGKKRVKAEGTKEQSNRKVLSKHLPQGQKNETMRDAKRRLAERLSRAEEPLSR